jgi:rhomboid family GlyGly-CTERM serine protease
VRSLLRDAPYRWTAVIALLSVALTALALRGGETGAWASGWLNGDAAHIRAGQWWRILTGSLVHTSGGHLLWDVGMLLCIGVAYEQRLRPVWPALIVLGIGVPAATVLIAYPELAGYGGTSGLTYCLLAAVLTYELVRGNRPWYLIAAGAVLAFKVVRELDPGAGALLFDVDLDGARPVPMAHLAGVSVGIAVVVAARATWPSLTRSRRPAGSS